MCYELARGAVPPPWTVMSPFSRPAQVVIVTALVAGANFLI